MPVDTGGLIKYRVYKYATGQDVPFGAKYLYSCKNGTMDEETGYQFVWHYFLVGITNDDKVVGVE